MESPPPSLMETLQTNAQYMPTDNKPSKCEEMCRREQESLVSCVNSIRDASAARAQDHGSDAESHTTSTDRKDSSCLGPMVASWTVCCTKANSVEDKDDS